MRKVRAVTLGILVLFAISVVATAATPDPQKRKRDERIAKLLRKAAKALNVRYGAKGASGMGPLDSNGDGKISRSEWPLGTNLFDKIDANRNGSVEQAELTAYGHAVQARGQLDIVKFCDRNSDGVVTPSEWRFSQSLFDQIDTGGNGEIDRTEAAAFNASPKAGLHGLVGPGGMSTEDLVRLLDKNGDDAISQSEWPFNSVLFNKIDANSDAAVTAAELTAFGATAAGDLSGGTPTGGVTGQIDIITLFDKDGDGAIARAEWPLATGLFGQADTDGNGFIDQTEATAFANSLKAGCRIDVVKLLDLNGNGGVSRSEWPLDPLLFNQFDTNRDGMIDETEAAVVGTMMQTFAQMDPVMLSDTGGDGKISMAEWQLGPQLFARFDTNSDGFLDQADAAAVDTWIKAEWLKYLGTQGLAPVDFIKVFDKNGNGTISFAEWPMGTSFFNEIDSNHNSAIEPAELAAFLASMNADWQIDITKLLDKSGNGTISFSEWPLSLALFNKFDADGDGKITRTEAAVATQMADTIPPAAVKGLAVVGSVPLAAIDSGAWSAARSGPGRTASKSWDLGSAQEIAAISMTPQTDETTFPQTWNLTGTNDVANGPWTFLAGAAGSPAARGAGGKTGVTLWQTLPGSYRYLKLVALVPKSKTGYHVGVSDVSIYAPAPICGVTLGWTATANDGSNASSGPASLYDIRISSAAITNANWRAANRVIQAMTPKAPGRGETYSVSTGSATGTKYVAVRAIDAAGNWSPIATSAGKAADTLPVTAIAPADGASFAPSYLPTFTFALKADAEFASIDFSDSSAFPAKPIAGSSSRTLRFALKTGAGHFNPTPSQWATIKQLAAASSMLYWRVEGGSQAYARISSPSWALLFSTGTMTNLLVAGSHSVTAGEAIWPKPATPPHFKWTDNTAGLASFFVDVSTDQTMPFNDVKKSIILNPAGKLPAKGSYTANSGEWIKLRRLAATTPDGVVYWRVRGLDSSKAITAVSATNKLVIDGGQWTLSDVAFDSAAPQVSWTCTGRGIVNFSLQFSANQGFDPNVQKTLTMPAGFVKASPYKFQPAEIRRLTSLATTNNKTTLYYRVRGEDSDQAFVTYSPAKTTPAP